VQNEKLNKTLSENEDSYVSSVIPQELNSEQFVQIPCLFKSKLQKSSSSINCENIKLAAKIKKQTISFDFSNNELKNTTNTQTKTHSKEKST